MTVMDAIRRRFSVRKFKPDEIEDEKLERVLEGARLAPLSAQPAGMALRGRARSAMRAAFRGRQRQRFVAEARR